MTNTAAAGDLMRLVRERLAEYGLEFTAEDIRDAPDPGMWKGTLRFGVSTLLVRVVLASPMTVAALARTGIEDRLLTSPHLPALVVGRHVHERSARAFRELGVNYADAAGNAFVRFETVLIDVRGRRLTDHDRTLTPLSQNGTGAQSSNLFSTGRAQVVAALLAWPHLTEQPVRTVAKSAGVSTGQAHDTLGLLGQAGYLIDRRLRRDRDDELLDLWAAAYPQGLGQKLAIASYRSSHGIQDLRAKILHEASDRSDGEGFALSGESVPHLGIKTPLTLTLYARDWTPRQAVRYRWRAVNSAAEADVHVRRRFWRAPAREDLEPRGGVTAPWPIVYADLVATGDSRLLNTAAEWREHRGAP